ncbi:uncharacterized protein LOC126455818 [Schistocerca serialis cubense]|uniref:uncharacterized protein LOC126455818 n=1 Tax=Schistocerca serialis cubense TaxID=2023355 RepID=UPI00214F1402|nr:uncharacterized protein LOC126455818 [Schistocerca serialis cubense]
MDNSTIIEGTVKFRDGKKWKSRWCVMRKLSPVADCLHLQLYRDSKERYKQGHTKASLSLQHFLAIETGFTLDKESNTIAIICQDVTVILAFDTRERQMQWQVKISNNLGEDVQFLIQITSAPPRAKIAAGPARLHVKEQRFCLTSGVPPRLLGFWDISQLRRYGVVEGRFVFEGGSRCGKGEGVHVCVTDQGDEITRTFQMAAQGKVAVRRRPVTRNMSMMDSPRRQMLPRTSEVSSVLATPALSDLCSDDLCRLHRDGSSPYWLSTESSGGARNSDLDSNYGCGDTSSVSDHYDQSAMSGGGGWHGSSGPGGALERCVSCMSKLGALSRSSTAGTCTPLTPGPPGAGTAACWLHDAQQTPAGQQGRDARSSAASLASSHGSDGPRSSQEAPCFWYDRPRLGTPPPVLPPKSPARAAPAASPCRPPKPALTPQRKPPPPALPLPLPLPLALPLGRPAACQNPACACACTRFAAAYRRLTSADSATSPYDNYDVPKPILGHLAVKDQMSNLRPAGQADVPDGYYDTPRSLREHLTTPTMDGQSPYGNYDVPASARPVQRICGCGMKYPRTPVSASADSPVERHSCPCQRMMGWAENLMTLPYCKRGNGVENTTMPITKVRLSGEGKMPVVSPNGDIAIYNPSDSVKKFVRNDSAPSLPHQFHRDGSSYGLPEERSGIAAGVTLEVSKVNSLDRNMKPKFRDYANLAFSESLEYYENARDVLNRAGMGQQVTDLVDQDVSPSMPQERINVCDKCRHTCQNTEGKSPGQSDEAENAVPPAEDSNAENEKLDADYVSMQSVVKALYRDTENTDHETAKSEEHLVATAATNEHQMSGVSLVAASSPLGSRQTEKSASSPNLEEAKSLLEVADILKRHAPLDELDASSQMEDSRKQQFANRKRSSSADASRFIDDVEDEPSSLDGPVSLPQAGSCDSVIHSQVMVADNVEPVSNKAVEVQQETSPRVPEPSSVTSTLHATEARIACMRRSSSVPSHRAASAVSGNNRDSSSSNDSGVSIASLRHRGGDFAEFELPLTTSMSARRHHMAMRSSGSHQHHHHHSPVSSGVSGGGRGSPCLHSSLPRRSKSVDPLRDITFQFTEVSDDSQQQQAKCSSAEAEVPVCPKRRGFQSPGGDSAIVVPYPDSRSTSSGTSDMSDYIETLSLSSHGSSDVPDSMRFGRLAVTTLKPRSGNEYQLIDRSALEGGPNVK